MSCLEHLCLGPQRLLRGGKRRFQGLAGRTTANTPALCANVLTPNSIPEFCIPPRLVPRPALAAVPKSWVKKAGTDNGAGHTDWDPRSQAALSLPHLPRTRTAYGFCALLESPHTRRKESLFLGDPGAAALHLQPAAPPALRPRAPTYHGEGGGDAPLQTPGRAPDTIPTAPRCPRAPHNTRALRPRGHHLLGASERLLNRALKTSGSHDLACARSVSSGVEAENKECGADSGSSARTLSAVPPLSPGPRPECLEAEDIVALGRTGGALRLAAKYSPAGRHLRLPRLRPEGPTRGAAEPLAVRSLVPQPPGKTRQQRSTVMPGSRKAVFGQDFRFDGLSEDEVRHLAVRVQAEKKGRGQRELLLGSLLLP
ncbi:C2 calcium-dependent domain-containing protein 4A [Artibeus jamaicensis]|uniref:C2 calcium-dependent domain-containing protein 4A n=1 Tax=Artibeus jamaicensis TaxID=9417 RepID=UPI00235AD308|nr:C2 calcium-dependent domain-containing protein 4A [Artibeus jamaicensis]